MKASDFIKKTAALTTQTAKKAVSTTVAVSKKFADFQIPASINWVYGFGFKIGIFLILKSFLILRYQLSNLSLPGFLVVATQLFMALIMIVGGVTMQSQRMYEDPCKLRRAANKYGIMTIGGTLISLARSAMNWDFFKNAASNWFMNVWTSITKGAGEITLSLLFWDFDLWVMLCALLYVIADVYLYEIFDDPGSLWGKVFGMFQRRLAVSAKATEHD